MKQYVCGMFYEIAPTDVIKSSFSSFQGMSHYNEIGRDDMSFYKKIIIDLLLSDIQDPF